MDPVTIISLAGACVGLAARVAAAASVIETIANADRSVTSLATTLRVFGASLEQLQQWLTATGAVVSTELCSAVRSSVADCETICADLEEHVRRVRPGERRMSITGRLRHLWSGNALGEQETRLSRQLQSVMLLVNLVKLNDTERQDAGIRTAETRTILARSAFDARSLRIPNDSASSIRNSVLSNNHDLNRSFDVDDELVRSGPYLSHYREMVSRQGGEGSQNRQNAHETQQAIPSVPSSGTPSPSTLRRPVSSPLSASTRSASTTSGKSSSSWFGMASTWKSSHESRLLVAQLCQASKEGNVRWAEQLLKDGAYIDGYCIQSGTETLPCSRWSTKDNMKATPLWFAANAGRVEMMRFLLGHGADPNNPDARVRSALCQAIKEATSGDEGRQTRGRQMVSLLLENEANAGVPEDTPDTLSPIFLALFSEQVMNMLLKHGANPNQRSEHYLRQTRDWRPLHAAAQGSAKAVGLLLDCGATIGLTCVYGGVANVTALHLAEDGAIAERLIRAGASVFAVDSNGQTPLFWAVKSWASAVENDAHKDWLDRIYSAFEVNIAHGSPVNLRDKAGKTPMDFLVPKWRTGRAIEALVAAGAPRIKGT